MGEFNDQLNHNTMFTLRRKAVQSAEWLPVVTRRSVQRYSTTGHGKTGEDAHHGSSTDHGHHHAEPVNEPLGVRISILPIELELNGL